MMISSTKLCKYISGSSWEDKGEPLGAASTAYAVRAQVRTDRARMLLVVRPGAPSSVLAPSSDALCY